MSCIFYLFSVFVCLKASRCLISRKYDYIIVGAGTSGSIVASKLSEDPKNSVLLIEEGPWSHLWDITKNLDDWFSTLSEPQISRDYFTNPEPFLNNRNIWLPRAKMTGGCGSHNALVWILGNKKDFDERWNINGWKWSDLSPIWDFINDTFPVLLANPLNDPWIDLFISAGNEQGFKYNPDPNNLNKNGAGGVSRRRFMAEKLENGDVVRSSSWTVYAEPILRRDNLDVLIYTRANKILFRRKKAIGLETYNIGDGKITQFYAKKEVIISGGVFDSPKLLLLSGLGNCSYLASLNIPCVEHIPGVGQNLEDHTFIVASSPPLLNQDPGEYFTNALRNGGGVIAIDENGEDYNGVTLAYFNGKLVVEVNSQVFHYESRGYVKLTDTNPSSDPQFVFNYLSTENDRIKFLNGLKKARNIIYSPTLAPLYENITMEGRPGNNIQTDEQLIEYGKNNLLSDWHPCCTCKMGNNYENEMDVVNNRLQVKNIKNLRIIDGSIQPQQISGNPNQIAMIIGFKGAQMILEDN